MQRRWHKKNAFFSDSSFKRWLTKKPKPHESLFSNHKLLQMSKKYKMLSKYCRPHQSAHIICLILSKLSFMSRTNGKDFKSWGLEEGINALRSRLVLNSGWNPQKWGKEENPGLAALPISTSNFEETIFFPLLLLSNLSSAWFDSLLGICQQLIGILRLGVQVED